MDEGVDLLLLGTRYLHLIPVLHHYARTETVHTVSRSMQAGLWGDS